MRMNGEELMTMVMMRGLGHTQTEIATDLGVSQSTVQYQLRKLREEAEKHGLNHTFWRVAGPHAVNIQVIPR